MVHKRLLYKKEPSFSVIWENLRQTLSPEFWNMVLDRKKEADLKHLVICDPLIQYSDTFGIEIDLSSPHPGLDFSYALQRKKFPALLIENFLKEINSDEQITGLPSLTSFLLTFLNTWNSEAGDLLSLFDWVWLEQDLCGQQNSDTFIPSIFFGTTEGNTDYGSINRGLSILGLSEENISVLIEKLDSIKEYTGSLQIGVMLPRKGSPVRLCVFRTNRDEMYTLASERFYPVFSRLGQPNPGFTDDITWQGIMKYAPGISSIDVDIPPGAENTTGIEFSLSGDQSPLHQKNHAEWNDFLSLLVHFGWCRREKVKAVLEWPGGNRVIQDDTDLLTDTLILRSISHIKVVFRNNSIPKVKAYLHFAIA